MGYLGFSRGSQRIRLPCGRWGSRCLGKLLPTRPPRGLQKVLHLHRGNRPGVRMPHRYCLQDRWLRRQRRLRRPRGCSRMVSFSIRLSKFSVSRARNTLFMSYTPFQWGLLRRPGPQEHQEERAARRYPRLRRDEERRRQTRQTQASDGTNRPTRPAAGTISASSTYHTNQLQTPNTQYIIFYDYIKREPIAMQSISPSRIGLNYIYDHSIVYISLDDNTYTRHPRESDHTLIWSTRARERPGYLVSSTPTAIPFPTSSLYSPSYLSLFSITLPPSTLSLPLFTIILILFYSFFFLLFPYVLSLSHSLIYSWSAYTYFRVRLYNVYLLLSTTPLGGERTSRPHLIDSTLLCISFKVARQSALPRFPFERVGPFLFLLLPFLLFFIHIYTCICADVPIYIYIPILPLRENRSYIRRPKVRSKAETLYFVCF